MWLLVSVTAQEKRHSIVGDKKFVVGRIGCDIIISDPSVSRKQAVLSMTHYESNVVKSFITPTLRLEDTSKFGTFVNGKSVRSFDDQAVSLKDGDEIQFGGSPASKFKAIYEPFIATTSCLEKAPKKSLQKIMCLLGGHVVRDWRNNCDLLIMSKINVTIKVICAINNQKRIVTPVYLDHYHKHLLGQREKPDPVDYLPEVVDKEVPPGVSFHPDVRRITLLTDLKFYFLSAVQFNKTNMAVSTAGGLPILLEDGTDEDAETMTKEGTIVVSVSREVLSSLSATCQKFVRSVCSALKKKNLRMVTDPEIGWAILTCNTNDFCNPKSAITPSMYSSMASQTLSQVVETDTTQQCLSQPTARLHERPGDSVQDTKSPSKEPAASLVLPSFNASSMEPSLKKARLNPQTQSEAVSSSNARAPSPRAPHIKRPLSPDAILPKCDDQSKSLGSKGAQRLQFVGGGFKPKNNRDDKNGSFSLSVVIGDNGDIDDDDKDLNRGQGQDQSRVTSLSDKALREKTDLSGVKSEDGHSSSPDPETRITSSRTKLLNGLAYAKESKRNSTSEMTSFLLDDSDEDLPARNAKTPEKKNKITSLFSDSDESPPRSRKRKNNVSLFDSDEDEDSRKNSKMPMENASMDTTGNGGRDICDSVNIRDVKTFPLTRVKVEEGSSKDHNGPIDQNGSNDVNDWVTGTKEVKAENGLPIKEEDKTEAFFDADGHRVQTFCVVKVMDLITRPPHSQVTKKPSPSRKEEGVNFKKFKKTQHIGSGELPKIIGGHDLQPYIGNKLQALEDLLSEERIDKRQDNHRKEDQLFGWDDDQDSTM